ncbi:MAG TPA: PP2C family protein-serine/threonine phosphatase [Terracidiphilus sp.]|nr:PP2C family protein-serine/threonine phosphatase [Terracidiphilus sp.]
MNTNYVGGSVRGRFQMKVLLAVTACLLAGAGSIQAQHPAHRGALSKLLAGSPTPPAIPKVSVSAPKIVFDATRMGAPVILDQNWRMGVTDDANAELPNFDDSKWKVHGTSDSLDDIYNFSGNQPNNEVMGPPGRRLNVYFRLHIELAPNHGPVALLVDLPVSQYTTISMSTSGPGLSVFANGKEIQPSGPNGDNAERYQEISRIYNLDVPPNETSLVLVIRTIYIPLGWSAYTNFFSTRTLKLGSPDELQQELHLWSARSLFERLPRLVTALLLTVLSLFLITLYFTQRGHREYLWLALHEFIQAPIGLVDLAGSTAHLDQLWYAAVVVQLVVISAYLYFEFLVAFLALKRRWYISLMRYSAVVLAMVGPALGMVGSHSTLTLIFLLAVAVCTLLWMTAWTLFTFLTLIASTLRRNFEAGLLLIPLLLTIVGLAEPILAAGTTDWGASFYHSPLTIQLGMVPLHFASIADFAGLLSIVVIIFRRFLRVQHDQERANSELAAARSVQELMIPSEGIETPGFDVDSVYTPASEVGGDFFYLEPLPNGDLLVVVGDVAGHGLQAAMNVSMLVGALRRIPEKSPARILEALNRVVMGNESYTTCQAAYFHADGEVIMANAGHLAPYLNSQEIALPGGLPLGALPEIKYDEMRLYLHPGDRILLLSDGVVEARAADGELFGFDRVHNLSNQTAFYIADAAKEFGQEDDITVLTVRRLAQAAAA